MENKLKWTRSTSSTIFIKSPDFIYFRVLQEGCPSHCHNRRRNYRVLSNIHGNEEIKGKVKRFCVKQDIVSSPEPKA